MLDSGVKDYLTGKVTVEVSFPIDWKDNIVACCNLCQLYKQRERRCCITSEIIPFPENKVGAQCPIRFEGEENG